MTELELPSQLRLNFHGDELHPLGGADMGAGIRAEAISHLEEVRGVARCQVVRWCDDTCFRSARRG